MSAETLSNIQNSLVNAYSSRFQEIFLRRVKEGAPIDSMFDYIRRFGRVGIGQLDLVGDGGGDKAARIVVKTSTGNTVSTFDSGDPRPAGSQLSDTTAEWEWRRYWTTIHLRGDAFRAATAGARYNGVDLLSEKVEDGFKDIKDQIDTDLCGAGGSGAIDGIDAAINDSGTYAGIDRATVANWKSYKKAAGAATITKAMMDDVDLTMRNNRRVSYRHILAPLKQEQKLGDLVDARRRDVNDILPGSLMYNGRPIIPIGGLTESHLYFINPDHIRMQFQPFPDGVLNGALQQGTNMDGVPFGLIVNDDGSDGVSVTIAVSCNLAYLNPWESGFIDDLA